MLRILSKVKSKSQLHPILLLLWCNWRRNIILHSPYCMPTYRIHGLANVHKNSLSLTALYPWNSQQFSLDTVRKHVISQVDVFRLCMHLLSNTYTVNEGYTGIIDNFDTQWISLINSHFMNTKIISKNKIYNWNQYTLAILISTWFVVYVKEYWH